MRKSHTKGILSAEVSTKGIFDAKFCKGILSASISCDAKSPILSANFTNSAEKLLNLKTPPRSGFSAFGLSGAFDTQNTQKSGAFATNTLQKRLPFRHCEAATADEAIHYATESRFEDTNSGVKNAPKARNGLLRYARNDGVEGGAFKAQSVNSAQNSQNSANFKSQKAQSVNFMEKFTQKAQKALAVSAVAAFCVALFSVDASAADRKNVTNITTNTTLNGTNAQGYNVTGWSSGGFFDSTQNKITQNFIGWRGDASGNPYQTWGLGNDNANNNKGVMYNGKWNQAYRGTVSQNNTNGTLYVIENVSDGYSNLNWTAFNITGGTTTITGDVNNIVFASYRFSMQDRYSTTLFNSGADKLIAVSNGATLNVGQTGQTTTLKVGFGNYGVGGVWVRSGMKSTAATGADFGVMGKSPASGLAQSMHSWKQNVIEVTGSNTRVNFNQNTYIVTTLDSTGNEPWYQVVNYSDGVDYSTNQRYMNWNWGNYYDSYGSRALYVGSNAIANIASGVTVETKGTVEFNTAGTFTNNGTLKTTKSTQWGDFGANVIFTNTAINNYGTIDVGRNLTATGNNKTWYNQGTVNVGGNANISSYTFNSYGTNSLAVTGTLTLSGVKYTSSKWANNDKGTVSAGALSMTNSSVDAPARGSNEFKVTGNFSMANSTFNANGNTLSAGNSTFSGTNNIVIDARSGTNNTSAPVNLGTSVSGLSKSSLRLLINDDVNSGNAYTAATTQKRNTGQAITYTYNKKMVSGTGVSESNVGFYNPNSSQMVLMQTVPVSSGLTTINYYVSRYMTTEATGGVTYNNVKITDTTTAYNPTIDPTPDPNPDPSPGPDPTPITPDTPTTPTESGDGRMILTASPILQGLVDVNFLLAQFDLVSKYQTNFNPDSLVDNRKRTIRKQREMAGYDRRGRRVIKTTKKTRYTEYDYNVWADAQYSNVTFDNGLGQNLQAQMLHNKVGADITAGFDGYYRAYVGYNYLNAKNQANDNTYKGSSYEGGVQVVADLSIRKFDFKTYADVAYAYNNIGVHAENRNPESDIATQIYDDDMNSHSIKVGVGVEKMMRFAKALDVGVAVDLDYTFQMGDGMSMPDLTGVMFSTPNFQNHSFSPGVKLFGGYNFSYYGTYVYVQGTAAYQILGQDEWLNVDYAQTGTPYGKVANAKYPNLISTAGIGVTQKVRRNFNISAAVNKIFSNAYTNNALQGRLQVSYRW